MDWKSFAYGFGLGFIFGLSIRFRIEMSRNSYAEDSGYGEESPRGWRGIGRNSKG